VPCEFLPAANRKRGSVSSTSCCAPSGQLSTHFDPYITRSAPPCTSSQSAQPAAQPHLREDTENPKPFRNHPSPHQPPMPTGPRRIQRAQPRPRPQPHPPGSPTSIAKDTAHHLGASLSGMHRSWSARRGGVGSHEPPLAHYFCRPGLNRGGGTNPNRSPRRSPFASPPRLEPVFRQKARFSSCHQSTHR
jgi:hypothetical protein